MLEGLLDYSPDAPLEQAYLSYKREGSYGEGGESWLHIQHAIPTGT